MDLVYPRPPSVAPIWEMISCCSMCLLTATGGAFALVQDSTVPFKGFFYNSFCTTVCSGNISLVLYFDHQDKNPDAVGFLLFGWFCYC